MKKLLSLGLFLFIPVTMASADIKVATVDLARAFDAYYKTKEDQQNLKEKEMEAQKEVQEKNAAYQHISDDVQKLDQESKDPTLSPEARAEKAKARDQRGSDLNAAGRDLQEFANERKKELQDDFMRRRTEVVSELTKVINTYSAAQGFDLVLDKTSSAATSGVPIVLYSSPKLTDITEEVIKQENVGAPATIPGTDTVPIDTVPIDTVPTVPTH
jgi:Skp family chaperone for outer membrane proteins